MNYEKAYNEALERAKKWYYAPNADKIPTYANRVIEEIFPELKDSEDEQIRKGLIKALSSIGKRNWGGIDVFESIAWLEKQGEKKPIMNVPTREVILAIWDLGNEWKELTSGDISTEYGTQLDYIQKHWHESEYYLREKQDEKKVTTIDFNAKDWYVSKVDGKIHNINISSKKQGEQKPTDNVEPKFKVGDFIVNDYCMGKVMKLTNDTYLLDTGQGIPFSCEHNAHLWTIQDAKDGDVLVDVYGNIGIFQKNDDFDWSSYCSLGPNGGFRCFAIEHELDGSHPATKEQRDLLFKKIEEAGYQWDSEKKELKLLISNGDDFESNNSKQKSTWSEKDEKIITALIEGFRYHQLFNPTFGEVPNAEIISWIKSLKERLS